MKFQYFVKSLEGCKHVRFFDLDSSRRGEPDGEERILWAAQWSAKMHVQDYVYRCLYSMNNRKPYKYRVPKTVLVSEYDEEKKQTKRGGIKIKLKVTFERHTGGFSKNVYCEVKTT